MTYIVQTINHHDNRVTRCRWSLLCPRLTRWTSCLMLVGETAVNVHRQAQRRHVPGLSLRHVAASASTTGAERAQATADDGRRATGPVMSDISTASVESRG